jgi:hypothetical protein
LICENGFLRAMLNHENMTEVTLEIDWNHAWFCSF